METIPGQSASQILLRFLLGLAGVTLVGSVTLAIVGVLGAPNWLLRVLPTVLLVPYGGLIGSKVVPKYLEARSRGR